MFFRLREGSNFVQVGTPLLRNLSEIYFNVWYYTIDPSPFEKWMWHRPATPPPRTHTRIFKELFRQGGSHGTVMYFFWKNELKRIMEGGPRLIHWKRFLLDFSDGNNLSEIGTFLRFEQHDTRLIFLSHHLEASFYILYDAKKRSTDFSPKNSFHVV